jgi:hypothetical protein
VRARFGSGVKARALSGVTVALLLTAPSMAFAQTPTTSPLGSGVAPLSPVPTTTTTTPPVVTNATTSGGGSLSSGSTFVIAAGAVLILGGISFFIWRDARRRAPVRDRAADPSAGERVPGSKRAKPRKLSPAERRRRKRGRAGPRR